MTKFSCLPQILRTHLKTANSETELTVSMTHCILKYENFDLKMSRRGAWDIKRRSICEVIVTLTVSNMRSKRSFL
jgi:hypothetical protein